MGYVQHLARDIALAAFEAVLASTNELTAAWHAARAQHHRDALRRTLRRSRRQIDRMLEQASAQESRANPEG